MEERIEKMDKKKSYLIDSYLTTRYVEPVFFFKYAFVDTLPLVGDEIHEKDIYTVISRRWIDGNLVIVVTDRPTSGVIKC